MNTSSLEKESLPAAGPDQATITRQRPATPRSPRLSWKALKKLGWGLFEDWRKLDAAGKTDYELKELADRLYQLHVDLHRLACRRETREAESKDWKLGNPTEWTVFSPDNILGMKITTRTPWRVIEQRVPTWVDIAGLVLFGSKNDLEKYKPQPRAAHPNDVLTDLEREWHPYDWEKKHASVGKRVDEVMAQWARRFERARAQEAAEQKEAA